MPLELPGLTDTQKNLLAMQTNLLTVNTEVNTLQENEKERDKSIKKLIEVVMVGNGEPALREVVRGHAAFISEIKRWVRYMLMLIITQLLAFAAASIVAYMKFLPVLEKLAAKP